jgi:putative peptidoglycan lipid II flippase
VLGLVIRLTSGALLSKVLGLVREVGMALIIGTAAVADSFRVAITAVLLPIAIFQNESVPAIIIPMQAEALQRGDAPRKLAALSIALVLLTAMIVVAMLYGSNLMLDLMVSGFSPDQKALTLDFVHIMAFAMPASVLLNCLSAGEIAIGLTRVTNARAATINVSILLALVMIAAGGGYILLGWSFAFAFNALGVWYGALLLREGHLSFHGLTAGEVVRTAKTFFARLAPFFPMPFAEQTNIWVERLAASRLATGSVASLDYARTLTESFFLLISQPIGLAVLSDTNRSTSAQDQAMFLTRHVLAIALPVCAFLLVFSDEIVRVLFQRGAFDETSVHLTSQAIRGISLGLWASTLGWILLRLLYRTGRSAMAAVVLILSYSVNIGYNLAIGWIGNDTLTSTFGIGIGEALRSYMLLLGVLAFLPGGSMLLRPIALAFVPTIVMALAGQFIETAVQWPLARLFVGGMVLILVVLLSGWLLVRPTMVTLLAKWKPSTAAAE